MVVSYEGEIEGKLLDEKSKVTIGDMEVTLAIGGAISFYKDQSLKEGVLAVATPITISDSSSYTLAIDTKVIFDASGSLIQGKISETDYVIRGNFFSFSSSPSSVREWGGEVWDTCYCNTIDDCGRE